MDRKGYIVDQKGLNICEKGKKKGVLDQNTSFIAEFLFVELEGTPPPRKTTLSSVLWLP